PENDPVVFTTDYGLEIKYANALTYLTGYTYFTAGGVNWVIIGYDPSVSGCVGDFTGEFQQNAGPVQGGFSQTSTIDRTPAGNAIAREMYAISSEAKPNKEIGDGCVLCLAEKAVDPDGVQFNTSTSVGNNYKGSNLEKYINETIYGGTSELSLALQALPIAPQKLTTLYYGSATSTIENAHLFPLAGIKNTESFYVTSYLDSVTKCEIGVSWWLRSGDLPISGSAYYVRANGSIASYYDVTTTYGVRPAFVLQLYSA
ncbi:MAG: hypothetical protein IKB21_03400, partial [Clostridia bacterium]|nr:hypothetical protein [Clostridia bacterium]